jgi:hypothetical protein
MLGLGAVQRRCPLESPPQICRRATTCLGLFGEEIGGRDPSLMVGAVRSTVGLPHSCVLLWEGILPV